MHEVINKNIFEIDAEALVNTVNCVGIMGKGLALQFKQAFPENFNAYKKACCLGKVRPGHIFIYEVGFLENPKFILNFPTKRHWKENSKIEDIQSGLKDLVRIVNQLKIKSIAVPPLGCGNGKLHWPDVRKLIIDTFKGVDVELKIIEPNIYKNTVDEQMTKPRLTRARALLIKLIWRYKELQYLLSLLEIQKLAYLLQESGEPLKLKFEQGHYGPFANNLNKALSAMEGHFIRGFDSANPKPNTDIKLVNNVVDEANEFLKDDTDALARLKLVENLIEGFETPYGLELLTTVHWIVHHSSHKAKDLSEAIDLIHKWNDLKKRKFNPDHIEITWKHLKETNWI